MVPGANDAQKSLQRCSNHTPKATYLKYTSPGFQSALGTNQPQPLDEDGLTGRIVDGTQLADTIKAAAGVPSELGARCFALIRLLRCRPERTASALLAGGHAEADKEMGFAGAGIAEHDDRVAGVEVVPCGEGRR